jgi:hypothetical protein
MDEAKKEEIRKWLIYPNCSNRYGKAADYPSGHDLEDSLYPLLPRVLKEDAEGKGLRTNHG